MNKTWQNFQSEQDRIDSLDVGAEALWFSLGSDVSYEELDQTSRNKIRSEFICLLDLIESSGFTLIRTHEKHKLPEIGYRPIVLE